MAGFTCILNKGLLWKLHCTELVSKNVQKLVDEDKEISVVAIGPNEYFAVVCTDGTARYHGPKDFNLLMQNIDATQIKCISFGSGEEFAITMEDGSVHHSFRPEAEISQRIKSYEGKVNYVSLSCNGSWLVGGPGAALTHNDCNDFLLGTLNGLGDANCKVHNVAIGNNGAWVVMHEKGITGSNIPKAHWEWIKEQKGEIQIENVCISLYDTRVHHLQRWQNLKIDQKDSFKSKFEKEQEKNTKLRAEIRKLKQKQTSVNKQGQDTPSKKRRLNTNIAVSNESLNIDVMDEKQLNELEDKYKMKLKEIQDAKEKLMDEQLRCIICLLNPKSVLIQGCNHMVLCEQCEAKMERKVCPKCHKSYTKVTKIRQ